MGRPAKYPAEFREAAVEMVKSSDKPLAEIARDLGINDGTLGNWVSADRRARGEQAGEQGLSESERVELARLRRENVTLRMEREILKKSGGLLRDGVNEVTRYGFIDAEKALYPVRLMCRLLKVSRSGFYAWRVRPASARQLADEVLLEQIRGFHASSREIYGAPRIHADLAEAGVHVGMKRVARLMRADALIGVSAVKTRYGTGTIADPAAAVTPDLVKRQFTADRPDQLWVADVTYVPTTAGWLYLATVLDVFSRRVIGWSMASHRKTVLVIDAVAMAVARRRGEGSNGVSGVIHHSDHGGEYSSHDLARELKRIGAVASMGSVGDCFDNSMAESLFSTLEKELFDRQPHGRFTSHREAKLAIFDYLETFYNRRRRHTALAMTSPEQYEQQHRHLTLAA